jgi:hypothetical protein
LWRSEREKMRVLKITNSEKWECEDKGHVSESEKSLRVHCDFFLVCFARGERGERGDWTVVEVLDDADVDAAVLE